MGKRISRARRKTKRFIRLLVVAVVTIVALVIGAGLLDGDGFDLDGFELPGAPFGSTSVPDAPEGSALDVAQELTVKGGAPRTGYEREAFGPPWKDVDENGCDTRNDMLNRDLTDLTHESDTCVVLTGTLLDPFSGEVIDFQRGQGTSQEVQIDHMVPLSDAWQKGAQQWDDQKRLEFANDPMNLLAVDGPLNAQKGDSDVATWLPPNKSFRCQYVAQIVGVKDVYDVWVTQAEQDAMVKVLSDCPKEPIFTGEEPPEVKPAP